MGKYLKSIQYFAIIYIIVGVCWQVLELMILGHTNPNNVDTIIGLILTMSLYENLRMRRR